MGAEIGTVVDETAPPIVPADEAPTDIPQPPAVPAVSSPAAEAKREPKAATVALATYEDLTSKAQRVDKNYIVNLPQEDGTNKQVRIELAAIDGPAYDKLIEKCPPTREQLARNLNANVDLFEPWLLQEVVTAPQLSKEQWGMIRTKPEWSGGEWASLVIRAQALCMAGLDVPFSGRG